MNLYVVTVDGRWKWQEGAHWTKQYYNVFDDCWYDRIYVDSIINSLDDARKIAAKVECVGNDEFEYCEDTLSIERIAFELVEDADRIAEEE